uniref:Uncharacterized protein n=1 Tax=Setaria italica TaxID=4555 RepID=K4ADX6_SETIT
MARLVAFHPDLRRALRSSPQEALPSSLQHAVLDAFAELPDGGAEQPPVPRRAVELHVPEELGGAVGQPLEPLHGCAGAGCLAASASAAGEHEERRDEAQDGVRDAARERRPRQPLPGLLLLELPQLPPVQRGVALVRGAPQPPAPPEQGRVGGVRPPGGHLQRGLHLDVRHLQPLDALPRAQTVPVPADEERVIGVGGDEDRSVKLRGEVIMEGKGWMCSPGQSLRAQAMDAKITQNKWRSSQVVSDGDWSVHVQMRTAAVG